MREFLKGWSGSKDCHWLFNIFYILFPTTLTILFPNRVHLPLALFMGFVIFVNLYELLRKI